MSQDIGLTSNTRSGPEGILANHQTLTAHPTVLTGGYLPMAFKL